MEFFDPLFAGWCFACKRIWVAPCRSRRIEAADTGKFRKFGLDERPVERKGPCDYHSGSALTHAVDVNAVSTYIDELAGGGGLRRRKSICLRGQNPCHQTQ